MGKSEKTPAASPVVGFDVYDTAGNLHQVWTAGEGGTLTLIQDVAFDYHDGATDLVFRKAVKFRVVLREVT